MKLRAEGKTYDRWKAKRQLINQKKRVEGNAPRKAGYDSRKGHHQEEDGSRPTEPVQVGPAVATRRPRWHDERSMPARESLCMF